MSQKIIPNSEDIINCPYCEQSFAFREGLSQHLIDQYKSEHDEMITKERATIEQQVVKEQEGKLSDLKEQLDESKQAHNKAKSQIEAAKKKAVAEAREDALLEVTSLKDEVASKDKRLAEFREAELNLRKEKKQLEQQKSDLALEVERKLEVKQRAIEAKINESFRLKEDELRKKITDAQKSNEELTRKLEQGSQQLQGEVLELKVENLLQQSYPLDTIEPVKKGARGADVIHRVNLRSGTLCGKIIWETKRAENWSNNWVQKLKEDLQRENGDIAVLVSTAFPADISQPMLQYEGVWLVRPELVQGLSAVLRTVLIESQRQKAVSDGKGEQMEALFDYVTSNQFAQRIRSVVENYELMRADLDKEKAAIQRIWKKREMQISRVSEQMLSVCGELQGISTTALPMLDNIAGLDLSNDDDTD